MNGGKIAISLGALAVFAFVVYSVFWQSRESACLNLLPRKASTGLNLAGQSAKVDIGAVQESTGADPQQAEAFIRCLQKEYPSGKVEVSNGVIIPRKPAGELADDWNGEKGLKLALEPEPGGGEERNKVLQNLAIGPAAGTKSAVVANWCKSARACVTCDPDSITDATNQVIVRLRPGVAWEKRQMAGSFPVAPQSSRKPWQDVNEKGERFYYECKANP